MKPGLVKDAAIRVSERFKERKEPVFFLLSSKPSFMYKIMCNIH